MKIINCFSVFQFLHCLLAWLCGAGRGDIRDWGQWRRDGPAGLAGEVDAGSLPGCPLALGMAVLLVFKLQRHGGQLGQLRWGAVRTVGSFLWARCRWWGLPGPKALRDPGLERGSALLCPSQPQRLWGSADSYGTGKQYRRAYNSSIHITICVLIRFHLLKEKHFQSSSYSLLLFMLLL